MGEARHGAHQTWWTCSSARGAVFAEEYRVQGLEKRMKCELGMLWRCRQAGSRNVRLHRKTALKSVKRSARAIALGQARGREITAGAARCERRVSHG